MLRLHTTPALTQQPRTISEILKASKALLEGHFESVAIFGEVGSITYASSGHAYFTLKDASAEIRCVMYRSAVAKCAVAIAKGIVLVAHGRISLYEARGEFQMQVQSVSLHESVGERNRQLELLKDELRKKGYFERKRKLPMFPRSIALLTSAQGAVVHDMQKVAQKRWRLVRLVLVPTLVQGEGAAENIAANLAFADRLGCDIVVLARGGGSVEDLWAFNERVVAEAIFAMTTPVVSAIGHEVDCPLSDFVADMRAPTPSAAMELLLPDSQEWLLRLDSLHDNLTQTFGRRWIQAQHALQTLQHSLAVFARRFAFQSERLALLRKQLESALRARLRSCSQQHGFLQQSLRRGCEHLLVAKQRVFAAHFSRLHAYKIAIQPKQQRIHACSSQLALLLAQILQLQKKRLHNLHIALEWYNGSSARQKGWVQLWYKGSLAKLSEIADNETFVISDDSYQAVVKMLRKRRKGEGHG